MKATCFFRHFAAGLAVVLALLPWGARAGQDNVFKFNDIFHDCQQVGEIRFGAGERWASCRVLHYGFVATLGLDDMFYAEYCLQDRRGRCADGAQVVFRNRAKHPDAVAEIADIAPRGARFTLPMMVGEDGADMMVLGYRKPGERDVQRRYLQYRAGAWQAMDARSWQGDLKQHLPAGMKARLDARASNPDPLTLAVRTPLYRAGALAGWADILLKVADGRLAIGDVNMDGHY